MRNAIIVIRPRGGLDNVVRRVSTRLAEDGQALITFALHDPNGKRQLGRLRARLERDGHHVKLFDAAYPSWRPYLAVTTARSQHPMFPNSPPIDHPPDVDFEDLLRKFGAA